MDVVYKNLLYKISRFLFVFRFKSLRHDNLDYRGWVKVEEGTMMRKGDELELLYAWGQALFKCGGIL